MKIFDQIEWLKNGEKANETTLNRPLKKLVQMLDGGLKSSRYEFIATANQKEFECAAIIVNPIVFVQGSIQSNQDYTFSDDNKLTFKEGLEKDSLVIIITL